MKKKKQQQVNTDTISLMFRNMRTLKKYLALHFDLSALREIDFLLFVKSFSDSGYKMIYNREFLNSDFRKTDNLFIELYGSGFIVKDPSNRRYYVSDRFNRKVNKLTKWIMEEGIELPLYTKEMKPQFREQTTRMNNYKRN